MGESYERAYQNMVRVQQLTELEETIEYSLAFQLAQGALSSEQATLCPCILQCAVCCVFREAAQSSSSVQV